MRRGGRDEHFRSLRQVARAADALRGRPAPLVTALRHAVNAGNLKGPWPGLSTAVFALGCFWGAERMFWRLSGVKVTAVG